MIQTPFGEILKRVVHDTPGAIGGALAAADGELVDSFTTWDEGDWAILTAHFGILTSHIRSALHTFHFGDVQFTYLCYEKLEVLIQIATENYFAIIAVLPPVHLPTTSKTLDDAVTELRREMM